MDLDQSFLSELPTHQRQKVCKQIRQKQLEKYGAFIKSERGQELEPRRQNKKRANVQFSTNLLLQAAVDDFDDLQVGKYLVNGGDANFTSGNGTSLLHRCGAEDNVSAAELLLSHGADVNIIDDDWWTPLHTACSCDSVEVIQLLLNNGANAGAIDVDGYFPIDQAADDSEAKTIMTRYLENLGMPVESLIHNRQVRPTEMLNHIKGLPLAVDVNKLNNDGVTLLHIAAANGYRRCLKALFKYEPNINKLDWYGWTPLHVAARFNQTKACELLLKRKANPNIQDLLGSKPSAVTSSDELRALLMRYERKFRESQPVYLEIGSSEEDIPGATDPPASHRATDSVYDMIDEFKVAPDKPPDIPSVERRPPLRINSKTVRSKHSSIAKEDELQESKRISAALSSHSVNETDEPLPPPPPDMLEDDEDVDDDYVSQAIWKSGAKEQGELAVCMDNDNLVTLVSVKEEAILRALKTRFAAGQIYTYIGDVLIAVNPFTELQYYAKDISVKYHTHDASTDLPPHIYGIAEQSYQELMNHGKSQCHVISGESGSGKTESCKFIIQHLLRVAGSEETNLNSKINQVNPLLEAFGNAMTVMNDNSSRFGKYVELNFSPDGKVIGANISEYILEKSRIVSQGKNEGNFHIFYWMMAGLSPEEVTVYQLHDMHKFRYLCGTKSEPASENRAKFLEVKECLHYIGFSTADIQNMFQTLSIVLHLGEIKFQAVGNNEAAQVQNADILKKVSDMLEVSAKELGSALVADYTMTRGEQIKKERTVEQASACRDALAKTLYARLFSWIVNGINQLIQPANQGGDIQIGILDIFGFENFPQNSFEQMCINVANEQIQMYTNDKIFASEQQDCLLEGVPLADVNYTSNQAILDLFLERPTGLLSILDEESNFPKATDKSLATKLHQNTGKKHSQYYKTPRDGGLCFTVVHYAGSVSYNVTGVLEKNRDTLPNSILYTMKTSNRLLIKELFQSRVTRTGSLAPSARQQRSRRTTMKRISSPFEFFKKFKGNKCDAKKPAKNISVEKKGPSTMAYHFRNSLADLVNKLQSAQPHFVRCIKPNTTKAAMSYVPEYILAQLRYTGISEIVKIRKYGYTLRLTFHEFLNRYPAVVACCLPSFCPVSEKEKCSLVLKYYRLSGAQFGKTKLFLKMENVDRLEYMTGELQRKVTKAQSVVRGFLGRRKSKRLSDERNEERQLQAKKSEVEEIKKSLDTLDDVFKDYEDVFSANQSKQNILSADQSKQGKPDTPLRDENGNDMSGSRSPVPGNAEDDDEDIYDDAFSPHLRRGDVRDRDEMNGHIQRGLPPTPTHHGHHGNHLQFDPSRPPPSPREMYSQGMYASIDDQQYDHRKQAPPPPRRDPGTRLSTASVSSQGTYDEIHIEPTSPHHPHHHHQQQQQQQQQHSPQRQHSPQQGNQFPRHATHGSPSQFSHEPQSPSHSANRPFSYGAPVMSPKLKHADNNRPVTMHNVPNYPPENGHVYNTRISHSPTMGRKFQNDQNLVGSPATHYGKQESVFHPQPHHPPPHGPPPPPPSSQGQQGSPHRAPAPHPQYPGSPTQQRRAVSHMENGSQRRPSGSQSPKVTPKLSQRSKSVPCNPDDGILPAPPPPLTVRENYLAAALQSNRPPSPPLPPPPPEMLDDLPPPIPPPSHRAPAPPSHVPMQNTPSHAQSSTPAFMHQSPQHQQYNQQQHSHHHQQQQQQSNQRDIRVGAPPPPPPLSSIPRKKTEEQPNVSSPGPTKGNNISGPKGAVNPGMPEAPNSREQSLLAGGFLKDITKVQLKKTEGEETPASQVMKGGIELSGVKLRSTSARIKLLEKDGIKTSTDEPPAVIEESTPAEPPSVPAEQTPVEPPIDLQDQVSPTVSLFKKFEEMGGTKDSKMGDITIDDIDLNEVPGYTPITKSTPIWKRDVIEKKNREKIEDYLEEKRREKQEMEKWKNVPAWKRQIMMEKDKDKTKKSSEDQKQAAEAEVNRKRMAKQAEEEKKAKLKEQQEMERKMAEELQDVPEWKREIMMKRGGAIKNWADEREEVNEQELEEQRLAEELIQKQKEKPPTPEPPKPTPSKQKSQPSKIQIPQFTQKQTKQPEPLQQSKNQPKKNVAAQKECSSDYPPAPDQMYAQKATLVLKNQKQEPEVKNTPAPQPKNEDPTEEDWESMPSWKREIMMKKGGAIRNWGDERAEVNEDGTPCVN